MRQTGYNFHEETHPMGNILKLVKNVFRIRILLGYDFGISDKK